MELGRICGILLREDFRHLLEINSEKSYENIGDFSETDFWKAYEKSEKYETINDAILKGEGYARRIGKEQMKRFREIRNVNLPSDADPSDVKLKELVNKSFYMTKKRMFQYIFRKKPDSNQNIAMLRHILTF